MNWQHTLPGPSHDTLPASRHEVYDGAMMATSKSNTDTAEPLRNEPPIEALVDEDGSFFRSQLVLLTDHRDRMASIKLTWDCANGTTQVLGTGKIPRVFLIISRKRWPPDLPLREPGGDTAAKGNPDAITVKLSDGVVNSPTFVFLDALVKEVRPAVVVIDQFDRFTTLDGEKTEACVHMWAKQRGVLVIGVNTGTYTSGS